MANQPPLLSVVVPVYNRAHIVASTLASIAAQTYRPFEVIVVDNNSTDGSLGAVMQWQGAALSADMPVRVLQCPKPGASAARNMGLEAVRTEWVMFFDSDDLMDAHHIAMVADAIAKTPAADIIGWDTTHADADGRIRTGRFFGHNMQRHNLFDGAMATQRWCARTSLVRQAVGWNESVGYWDDIELGARMLVLNPSIAYIGKSGVTVRATPGSISGTRADNPARIEPALAAIEATLGTSGRDACLAKRAIEYALCTRAGNPAGARAMKALQAPLWLKAIYHYTRLGGRGAGRFVRLK